MAADNISIDSELKEERISDNERIKLIRHMKNTPALWDVNMKTGKNEKKALMRELEEEFELRYTASELMALWKSLRSSMLREYKKKERTRWQVPMEIFW